MTKLIHNHRERVDQGEEGFTLIELMVVVLIIGILMAIAIPTFLSAKNGANAKAAQENVRNSLTTEAAYFSNNQTYTNSASALQAQEPNITFATWPSSTWTANTVYVEAGPQTGSSTNDSVVLAALGKDNNCYYVLGIAGQTFYAQGPTASSGTCQTTLTTTKGSKAAFTVGSTTYNWQTAWTGGSDAPLPNGVGNLTSVS